MANLFLSPGTVINGEHALDDAKDALRQLGTKALVVTDSMMVKLGNLDKVTAVLEDAGMKYEIYSEINQEPNDKMILAGADLYRSKDCDCIVALGGGSPIDSMKAIALLTACGGAPVDYKKAVVTQKLAPMAAIPTTAGTGSEATQFTIITDTASEVKMLLKGPAFMPDLAIIDPQFTMTAPPKITAATGVDALCHAIEAYSSKKAQPLSDSFALSACKRIFGSLKNVYDNGSDMEGRIQMSVAALEAGIAFNNSSVTIVHGMSRPIGALFHVAHGISNAMLLNVCLEYIADGAPGRFADIARACGFASEQDTDADAAAALLAGVKQLLADLDIPTLKEYGIDKEAFMQAIPKMASDAFDSGSPSNTRKEITVEAMEMLYRKLW